MTGRERLTRILNGQPGDGLAWTTLVDDKTRSVMPASVRQMPILDFYRHLECDIFCFGNYGLPGDLCVPNPAVWHGPEITTEWEQRPEGLQVRRQHTPFGSLTATFRHGHPAEHPVGNLEQVRTLTEIWRHTTYLPGDQQEVQRRWQRVQDALGDDGIYVAIFDPTPIQTLLEFDFGMLNFYALLQDYPAEMEELFAVMLAARRQEWEIAAALMPATAGMSVDNTSTTMISPALYERYGVPEVRAFCQAMHRHGKKAVLHMCGHVRGLLPHFPKTGMDALNATTPPPVGDCPFDAVWDVMGEPTVILGGIFDSTIFDRADRQPELLHEALDRLYTPRVRRAPFLLWFGADGLETPVERFYVARDWFRRHGGR